MHRRGFKSLVFGIMYIAVTALVCAWAWITEPIPTLRATSSPDSAATPSAAHLAASSNEPWIVPGRRYYFPVQPPRIARYSRRHHDYPASDIFAPVGSIVVAVTDGVVDEANRVDLWDRRINDGATRGGLWVTIIGDDGVRYHTSHLSSVEPGIEAGMRVYAGQVIGRSGKTGNAASTPPHVHFGISRPSFPGDWVNRRGQVWPYRYLKAWTRGEDIVPDLPSPQTSD
jgi:murein DD-endopeptidase MepM/ murein hydrolase activator NlpD